MIADTPLWGGIFLVLQLSNYKDGREMCDFADQKPVIFGSSRRSCVRWDFAENRQCAVPQRLGRVWNAWLSQLWAAASVQPGGGLFPPRSHPGLRPLDAQEGRARWTQRRQIRRSAGAWTRAAGCADIHVVAAQPGVLVHCSHVMNKTAQVVIPGRRPFFPRF